MEVPFAAIGHQLPRGQRIACEDGIGTYTDEAGQKCPTGQLTGAVILTVLQSMPTGHLIGAASAPCASRAQKRPSGQSMLIPSTQNVPVGHARAAERPATEHSRPIGQGSGAGSAADGEEASLTSGQTKPGGQRIATVPLQNRPRGHAAGGSIGFRQIIPAHGVGAGMVPVYLLSAGTPAVSWKDGNPLKPYRNPPPLYSQAHIESVTPRSSEQIAK